MRQDRGEQIISRRDVAAYVHYIHWRPPDDWNPYSLNRRGAWSLPSAFKSWATPKDSVVRSGLLFILSRPRKNSVHRDPMTSRMSRNGIGTQQEHRCARPRGRHFEVV